MNTKIFNLLVGTTINYSIYGKTNSAAIKNRLQLITVLMFFLVTAQAQNLSPSIVSFRAKCR